MIFLLGTVIISGLFFIPGTVTVITAFYWQAEHKKQLAFGVALLAAAFVIFITGLGIWLKDFFDLLDLIAE
ncbi:hypothetical protein ACI7RC_15910 [Brevibacillus sp. B_LB10_24]|uniref:hypothetical protein n=1 Tax=Brevibacillus sp. B_LB10_24 TaxID=3380645 RepID=UPI0038B85161